LDAPKVNLLLNQYLPGNLTAIVHTEDQRFENVWLDNKIAIRIPKSQILRTFIEKIGHPIVSTSINISNEPFCNDLDTLHSEYSDWFDYGLYNPSEGSDLPLPSTVIGFHGTSPSVPIREGSIPYSEIWESYEKPLIQFVCIGNICRSPLAEIYMNHLVTKENLSYRVASCGLNMSGNLMSENSRIIIEKNGLAHDNRLSVQVDADIIRKSVVLLCMTKDIKKGLIIRFPYAKNKIFTFAEYIGDTEDVCDPYLLDYSYYETAWKIIKKYSDALLQKIR
jgi:protein-tyrosine phosphatase